MGTITHKIRGFICVKSNDGHDRPILEVARALKDGGIEVIYGSYDVAVDQAVRAVIQEGVQFAGISSYNGAHLPFLRAVRDELQRQHCPHIHLIGGGGATITPEDIKELEKEEGIDKIFQSREGLHAIPFIRDHYNFSTVPEHPEALIKGVHAGDELAISGLLNLAEEKAWLESLLDAKKLTLDLSQPQFPLVEGTLEDGRLVREALTTWTSYGKVLAQLRPQKTPTYGLSGHGGAGKSTLLDSLAFRLLGDPRFPTKKVAVIAVDPSSSSTGGARLEDRIQYQYLTHKAWVDQSRVYIRSVASRGHGGGSARAVPDMITIFQAAGYDVFVEGYGAGQPDSGLANLVETSLFVATPDIGSASQLAKEEMLHLPGVYVALNKSDHAQAVQMRSLLRTVVDPSRLFCTIADRYQDPGVEALYQALTRPPHDVTDCHCPGE